MVTKKKFTVRDELLYDCIKNEFAPFSEQDAAFALGVSAGHLAVLDGDMSFERSWQDNLMLPFGSTWAALDAFEEGRNIALEEARTERIML